MIISDIPIVTWYEHRDLYQDAGVYIGDRRIRIHSTGFARDKNVEFWLRHFVSGKDGLAIAVGDEVLAGTVMIPGGELKGIVNGALVNIEHVDFNSLPDDDTVTRLLA